MINIQKQILPGFKPSPIGPIPYDWDVIALGNIFKLSSGKTKPKYLSEFPSNENKYPVYGGNGIMGYANEFNFEGKKIIIGRVGEYCGVTRFINGPCWITDNALVTRDFSNDVDIKFLVYKLQQENISNLRSKGGQPLISQSPIYIHKIAIPGRKTEQIAIATLLNKWDVAISKTTALVSQIGRAHV